MIWDIESDIRLGELSPHLLRPYSPLLRYLSMALSDKPLRLLMMVPICAIDLLFAPGALPRPDALSLAALPLAIALAFLVYALCSGYLVPLDLFPPQVTFVIGLLPFRAMQAFPLDLLLGRLDATGVALGLAHQLLWARGLRRYGVVGA